MTPLRRRMIEELQLRGYADRTVEAYVRAVAQLARFYARSPERLSEEQARDYLVQLNSVQKVARATHTIALCGIEFFYEKTLGRSWTVLKIARPKHEEKLPVVLDREEVWRIFDCVRIATYRVCLTTIYGCGLRLSEGARLQVPDVDGARGMLLVHGKRGKDRYVPLPQATLELLRRHWRSHRNPLWLFPSMPRRRKAAPVEPAAGGLTPDGEAWIKPAHRRFLVPGYALSQIFRAKMRDGLERAGLDPAIFRKPWTVHVQPAGDGRDAAEYLSRYVHRVALTNDRIEAFDGERVTFRYVSSRTQETRRLTLPVHDYLARFLQHCLRQPPKGFPKVRAYGLLSPVATKRRERARELLALDPAAPARRSASTAEAVGEEPSPRHRRCPACRRGHLVRVSCSHRPIPPALAQTLCPTRAPPP